MKQAATFLVRVVPVVCLLSTLGLGPASPAQQESKQPALKGATGYTVLVDAVVTDGKNRVVTDLAADDFVILEDGVEQAIDIFQFREPEPGAEAKTQAAAASDSQGAALPAAAREGGQIGLRRNLIVFLLDYATTEYTNQKLVQEACEKYIKGNLKPNDYAAVFALGSSFHFLQDFTNNRDLLLAALTGREVSGNALAAKTSNPSPAGVDTADSQVEPITASGSAAAGAAAQAAGSSQADLMLAQRIQQLYYTMSSYLGKREAQAVLSAIQAIANGVEHIEGRKTLLLFSQGFVVNGDIERELQRTISSANRANLAIYGMDSEGLATRALSSSLRPSGELSSISASTGRDRIKATGGESLFDRARQVGSDVRDSALRYIAAATGGFTIRNTNDLHLSLERVDQDIRSYYLLGYRPAHIEYDGEFRKIEVRVKKKGLSVRARSGYLAVPPGLEILSAEEYRLLRDVETGKVEGGIPVYFRIDRFSPGAEARKLALTLEIPGDAIEFKATEENGETKQQAQLSILGLARTLDGHVALRFGSPVFLSAAPPEYQALREGGVSLSNFVELEPGTYSFELIVRDLNSGRTGTTTSSLMLRPPEGETLSLSSIVLGKDVETAGDQSQGIDFQGTRILPSASRKFKPGDRLVFFLSAYNAHKDEHGSPKLRVEISISRSGSAKTAKLPAYTLTKAGESGEASTSKYIELRGFQPGTYLLSAVVTDVLSGERTTGRTPFQVVEAKP